MRLRRPAPGRATIHFVVLNAFTGGGINRVVFALARRLVDQGYQVEVTSLIRTRKSRRYILDKRVKMVVLDDQREPKTRWARWLAGRPSALTSNHSESSKVSLWTDLLLRRRLRSMKNSVVITSRPVLHVAAGRWAPRGTVTIAHEHLNLRTRLADTAVAPMIDEMIRTVDAVVTLSQQDAQAYQAQFPAQADKVRHIPNPLAWAPAKEPPDYGAKVIVSAGRLAPEKNFPRMIEAFAVVAREHPDWSLQIYGRGTDEDRIRAAIAEHGLTEQVQLMGFTKQIRTALRQGSIFALSSNYEGFALVLIEAMSVGLPVVSVDCPRGPAEIVRDGHNGRLVPMDPDALAAALLELVESEELRRQLGEQALLDVRRFTRRAIGRQWAALFRELRSQQ